MTWAAIWLPKTGWDQPICWLLTSLQSCEMWIKCQRYHMYKKCIIMLLNALASFFVECSCHAYKLAVYFFLRIIIQLFKDWTDNDISDNDIFFLQDIIICFFCCCLKHFSSLFVFIPFTGQPHKQLLQHTALVNGQKAFLKTGTFWGAFTTNRKKYFLMSANPV